MKRIRLREILCKQCKLMNYVNPKWFDSCCVLHCNHCQAVLMKEISPILEIVRSESNG